MAQYRGGRSKGKKNLKKENGYLVNQFGVKFTEDEKKALESLVNSANRKRKVMLELESQLPLIIAGKDTGKTIGESLGKMGKESDFVLAKKTKSLQRFATKKEYERYVDNLKRVVDRNYIDKRVEQYKKNYIKALRKEFGKGVEDLVSVVEGLSTKDYMKKVQSDESLEIRYAYSHVEKLRRLSHIRNALTKAVKMDAKTYRTSN